MVHQYKNNGYNILLDVNSGSVHVVDDLIYDMIPYYKEKGLEETVNLLKDKYPEQDIREAAEDLDELIKEGKLYTEDIYENYIHDIVAAKKPVVKALCLQDVYKRQHVPSPDWSQIRLQSPAAQMIFHPR